MGWYESVLLAVAGKWLIMLYLQYCVFSLLMFTHLLRGILFILWAPKLKYFLHLGLKCC